MGNNRPVGYKRSISIDEKLTTQLEGVNPSPEVGFIATKKLLANKKPFTAIFAFNDMSAIGAIRALQSPSKLCLEI